MNEQLDSLVKRRRIMTKMKEPLGSAVKSHRIRARDSELNTAQKSMSATMVAQIFLHKFWGTALAIFCFFLIFKAA